MPTASQVYTAVTYTTTTSTGGSGGAAVCTVVSPTFVIGAGCPGVGGIGGLGGQGGVEGFDPAKANSMPPIPPKVEPNGSNGVAGALGGLGVAGGTGGATFPTCTVCFALVDVTAPAVAMTAPTASFVSSAAIALSWTATDAGSGVASTSLRWARVKASGGTLSAYVTPATWTALLVKNLVFTAAPGYRYCFSVRGRDKAGNVSAWSGPRCTSVPYDDRALTASTGWTRATGAGWMSRTYTSTTRKGASQALSLTVRTRQVGVVAYTCTTCGTLAVYVGATKVGSLSLVSATATKRLLVLPRFTAARTGVVKVVVTSTGKLVRLDGLAVTAF
jgi:hypothetical protein